MKGKSDGQNNTMKNVLTMREKNRKEKSDKYDIMWEGERDRKR